MALEPYQQNPEEFLSYSSKYDAWLRHQGRSSSDDREACGV